MQTRAWQIMPVRTGSPWPQGSDLTFQWSELVKRSTPRWKISCCTSNHPLWKKPKHLLTFVDFQGNIHHIWDCYCGTHLDSLTRLPVSSGTEQNLGSAANSAWSRRLSDTWGVPGELRTLYTPSGQVPTAPAQHRLLGFGSESMPSSGGNYLPLEKLFLACSWPLGESKHLNTGQWVRCGLSVPSGVVWPT